jgi:hypothetical protein
LGGRPVARTRRTTTPSVMPAVAMRARRPTSATADRASSVAERSRNCKGRSPRIRTGRKLFRCRRMRHRTKACEIAPADGTPAEPMPEPPVISDDFEGVEHTPSQPHSQMFAETDKTKFNWGGLGLNQPNATAAAVPQRSAVVPASHTSQTRQAIAAPLSQLKHAIHGQSITRPATAETGRPAAGR